MARSRNIKPGFFRNEQLVDLPFEYRLLFQGLWLLADREGRLLDRPRTIKMELFPSDGEDLNAGVDVNSGLNALHSIGLILRYSCGETRYLSIPNFKKHQNPHMREPASEIPAPDKHSASIVQAQCKHEYGPADSPFLIPDSPLLSQPPPPPQRGREASPSTAFDLFWAQYPKKKNRGQAEKAWAKIKPDAGLVATILAAVEVAKASDDWCKDGGAFVPYPATWLSAKGWLDETRPAEYSEAEATVFDAYNRLLTPRDWPEAIMVPYSPERAAAIREFLGFGTKPSWVESYLGFIAESLEARPGCGFDWAIRKDTYLRCREGNFAALRDAA